MKLSEFTYKLAESREDSIKGREFYSLVPIILTKHNITFIRDYLDTDGTFSVLVPSSQSFDLLSAIELFTDVRDIISRTTYTKVIDEGLIRLQDHVGFWILVE